MLYMDSSYLEIAISNNNSISWWALSGSVTEE